MNQHLKTGFWLAVAMGSIFWGLNYQKNREITTLKTELADISKRSSDLNKESALLKAKLELMEKENAEGTDFEEATKKSLSTVAEEQKKIKALVQEWKSLDAARKAAVQEARDKEKTRPAATIKLKDGTVMEKFAFRSAVDEKTVSAENSNGIIKLDADKLPDEMRTRLGFGWNPEQPVTMFLDKSGNPVVKKAVEEDEMRTAAAEVAKELGSDKSDTATMEGVASALAKTEALVAKATTALETQRQKIRQLAMFKQDLIGPEGKTYAVQQKEANKYLATLAGRLQALRYEKIKLQAKLKAFPQ
jgi:hypothetical protein